MRNLTTKQLQEAPEIIQKLYFSCEAKIAIPSLVIEDCIKKHPYYFPNEIESREIWNRLSDNEKLKQAEGLMKDWENQVDDNKDRLSCVMEDYRLSYKF